MPHSYLPEFIFMKPVKTILSTSFVVLSIFAVTLFSCNKSGDDGPAPVKCGTIYCTSGKICVNDGCVCPDGTYGDNCELKKIDNFLGVWLVTEKGSSSNAAQYSIQITAAGNDASKVNIQNYGNRMIAKVTATFTVDSLTIPLQTLDGRWEVMGNGIFETNGGALHMAK